ncbi:MAG: helix-hairpin-helix domain-containing protein [Bacteroidota bacterium]
MWKRILTVAHRAGFTQNEAGVIVFLVVALLAGGMLEAFRSSNAQAQDARTQDTQTQTAQRPDAQARQDVRQALAEQDSVFAARSMEPAAARPSSTRNGMEEPPGSSTSRKTSKQPGIIGLNSAMERDLEKLPGIGPATAEKIVAYRKENGRFARIEDLMLVKSIGPKKFEKIRHFITLE